MNEPDTIQRFMFEHQAIRGEIVHLNQSYQQILAQHPYPPVIQQLLGETLLACVLLTSTLKFAGTLTIQFHGNGPISLLVAKCDDALNIRGLAKFEENTNQQTFQTAFAQGKLVITIADHSGQSYQSIVPLEGHSISTCLENYFSQSEQLATKIQLAVGTEQAAGILLQLLPTEQTLEREQFWAYAAMLATLQSTAELTSCSNTEILQSLYPEEDLRLFEYKTVAFSCTCNVQKMANALQVLGQSEAEAVLLTSKTIEMCCEYCHHKYAFDRLAVDELFKNKLQ